MCDLSTLIGRQWRVTIPQLFNVEAAVYSKILKWMEVVVLAAGSIAALIVALMVVRSLGEPLWTEKAAGWAQAILTTAGIGFALYTAQGAQRHVEELKREDLKQRRQGVLAIAFAAYDKIRIIDLDAMNGRLHFFFDETYRPGYFNHALTALQAVPLHELRSYDMTVGTLELIEVLTRMERYCEAHADGERSGLTYEEAYFIKNSDSLIHAIHAVNSIKGGAEGMSTEEIERQNSDDDPADF